MKNIDSVGHVKGESIYVDDLPIREDTLFAIVISSKIAHGKIKSINLDIARESAGIHSIITARDIPGENQIGGIILMKSFLPLKKCISLAILSELYLQTLKN